MRLSRCRPVYGMGAIGAIPPEMLEAQLRLEHVDEWTAELLGLLVMELDDEYLSWESDRAKARKVEAERAPVRKPARSRRR